MTLLHFSPQALSIITARTIDEIISEANSRCEYIHTMVPLQAGLILILAWISISIHYKVWVQLIIHS